jgi:hypothetical protein
MSETEFAKNHLREHLSGILIGPVSDGFWSIHTAAKDACERTNQPAEVIKTFQNMISRIPEWSDSTLSTEVERIAKVSKCTYIDDLLMGVFIAYMKAFASLQYRGSSSQIKIEFERPNFAKFVHELYKHSARKFWQVAYLFKTSNVPDEQQARNRQDIHKVIASCMDQVIHSFLPWEQIAKKYFVEVPDELPTQEAPGSKVVTFESMSEPDDDESSDEEEDELPLMKVSDETQTIDIQELDKKEEAPPPEVVKDLDALSEIESKIGETLVINL